jgi:hypothetical protein
MPTIFVFIPSYRGKKGGETGIIQKNEEKGFKFLRKDGSLVQKLGMRGGTGSLDRLSGNRFAASGWESRVHPSCGTARRG